MINKVSNLTDVNNARIWLRTKKDSIIGLDTETNGLDPISNEVLLIQFGDKNVQWVLDVARIQVPPNNIVKNIISDINDFNITCIMHNAKFDYEMIKANFDIEIENMICTYLSARLLTMGKKSNISLSLSHSAKRFLGKPLEKETRETFIDMSLGTPISDEQLEYSAEDVAVLIPLWEKLRSRIQEEALSDVALLEFETIKVTGDMELNGSLIDTKLWRSLEETALKEAEAIKQELNDMFRPYVQDINLFGELNINYNSQPQMKELLSKITNTALDSTDKKTLAKLKHPVGRKLLDYREKTKLSSTYGTEFLRQNLKADGKIHANWRQLEADTGRYGCRNPKHGWGIIVVIHNEKNVKTGKHL